MSPLVPSWLLNISAPLMPFSVWQFGFVTLIGSIPTNALGVQTGALLSKMQVRPPVRRRRRRRRRGSARLRPPYGRPEDPARVWGGRGGGPDCGTHTHAPSAAQSGDSVLKANLHQVPPPPPALTAIWRKGRSLGGREEGGGGGGSREALGPQAADPQARRAAAPLRPFL